MSQFQKPSEVERYLYGHVRTEFPLFRTWNVNFKDFIESEGRDRATLIPQPGMTIVFLISKDG